MKKTQLNRSFTWQDLARHLAIRISRLEQIAPKTPAVRAGISRWRQSLSKVSPGKGPGQERGGMR